MPQLDQSDARLKEQVPGRTTGGDNPDELKDGGRRPHDPEDEGDHDQPESPAPTPQHAVGEHREEGDRHVAPSKGTGTWDALGFS
jgi:hypothetical protein